ncbi:MAG TPA: MauE/DoxX family redox-associated membrane protein [Streptosporangiaceae bacterium]|nr:MauE/DoxX family redox-associated membrane protein [Streptosporangiaceae bacterium]
MGELIVGLVSMTAIVFGASAASKLRSGPAFRAFAAGLRETSLLPDRLLPRVATLLAGGEAAIAVLLAAAALVVWAGGGVALAIAALAAAALLTVMLAAGVAVVMRRGVSARCACFGAASDQPLGRVHLIRNLSLLAVEVIGIALSPLALPPAPAGGAVALFAALIAALLVIRWEDLAALVAPLPPALRAPPR